MRQFRQRAAHRFPGQARIRIYDFGDREAGGERLPDERHGNARAAHTRASAQMFRVGDNPVLHAVKLLQLRNKSSRPAGSFSVRVMAAECHRQMLFATFFSTWDFSALNQVQSKWT